MNLDGDGPIPLLCIVPHCRELQWQRLLVVGGDAGVEPDAKRFCPGPKTPLESGGEALCIISGLDMRTQPVQKLYFLAITVAVVPEAQAPKNGRFIAAEAVPEVTPGRSHTDP